MCTGTAAPATESPLYQDSFPLRVKPMPLRAMSCAIVLVPAATAFIATFRKPGVGSQIGDAPVPELLRVMVVTQDVRYCGFLVVFTILLAVFLPAGRPAESRSSAR